MLNFFTCCSPVLNEYLKKHIDLNIDLGKVTHTKCSSESLSVNDI